MVRSTTNSVLKTYRYNLQRSSINMDSSRDKVLTGRTFDTFAQAPAKAAKCFQLRRSFQTVNAQYEIGESVSRKYEQAWSCIDGVLETVQNRQNDSAFAEIISSSNDVTGPGRTALGQSLSSMAKEIIQSMNCTYAGSYVFAGADGLNIPFTWDDSGNLCYRGVAVDSNDTTLDYMANDEKRYVDLGLGLKEEDGKLIGASAFDSALQGITFLGYGVDEEGDPKNIVSIIARMGAILENCSSADGSFASEDDRTEFYRLAAKFDDAAANLSDKYIELDTRAKFIQNNQAQLENTAYTLEEQFLGLEDADPAEAISAFTWAQYCYNTALKVGNSVLSQSLMDYLNL
ncbi:MAG: hypothetical protein HUJ80_08255 [Firmicutes bacterium]|nr:hypothetical protein [Bacillota bacterium]